MAEKRPKKKYEDIFTLAEPFANFQAGDCLIWTMYDRFMKFAQETNKKNTATMEYGQLTDADYVAETETVLEKKSVAGSAVKGSLIWGQTGALIGAMKAMKDDGTEVEKTFYYVVLSYIGSDGADHEIRMQDFRQKNGLAMVKNLREMLGKPVTDEKKTKPAGNVKL